MRLPAIYCEPRVEAHMDDNFANERDAWTQEAARFHVIDLYKMGLIYEFQHHKKINTILYFLDSLQTD